MRRSSTPHEPGPGCRDDHCYSCNLDEPLEGGYYILCGECFHVYYTKAELRRAYRRVYWRTHRWAPFGGPPTPMWRILWRVLTVRAKDIYFCQECTHDF